MCTMRHFFSHQLIYDSTTLFMNNGARMSRGFYIIWTKECPIIYYLAQFSYTTSPYNSMRLQANYAGCVDFVSFLNASHDALLCVSPHRRIKSYTQSAYTGNRFIFFYMPNTFPAFFY